MSSHRDKRIIDGRTWIPEVAATLERDALLAENQRFGRLLVEAYTRLMVSEGDARYIAANVELALRIEQAVPEAGQ